MAIVVFVMGSFVGLAGWGGRVSEDKDVAIKSRSDQRKLAPWMFLFMALGYIGGILSLVMQHHPTLKSPHFYTGSVVLLLLLINSAISLSGFGGNKAALRTLHAYVGSTALCILFVHVVLGLKLGISL